MRAGLLSEPPVIELINDKFVSTWVLIDDLEEVLVPLEQRAGQLDALGHHLAQLDLPRPQFELAAGDAAGCGGGQPDAG